LKFTKENPKRPVCCVDGCERGAQNQTGGPNPKWRKSKIFGGYVCATHHGKKIAHDNGVKSVSVLTKKRREEALSEGYSSVTEKNAVEFERNAKKEAKRMGVSYSKYIRYKGTGHEHLMYRKEYCENVDGRLGHVCTTTIVLERQLHVDHIDGNPDNHDGDPDPSNLQTLCADCHIVKTYLNEDYKTPGRKAIKEEKKRKKGWETESDLSSFFEDTGITTPKIRQEKGLS